MRAALLYLAMAMAGVLLQTDASATLHVDPAAQQARDAVMDWTRSLHSFDGRYTVHQESLEDSGWSGIRFEVEYRMEGANRYMATTTIYPDRTVGHVDALLDGDLQSLVIADPAADAPPAASIGLAAENWLFPPGAIATPESLFREPRGLREPLEEFMREGHTSLHLRDGQTVLRHRRNGVLLDMWLRGDDFQVERREISYTDFSPEEIQRHWPGDPFEIRDLVHQVAFHTYANIDGVQFPTRATISVWDRDKAARDASRAERDALGMPPVEWFIKLCTELPKHQTWVQVFELDVPSARVNAQLPPSAFRIDFPPDAVTFDHAGYLRDNYVNPFWKRMQTSLLRGAQDYRVWLVLVLLLGSAVGVSRILRNRGAAV